MDHTYSFWREKDSFCYNHDQGSVLFLVKAEIYLERPYDLYKLAVAVDILSQFLSSFWMRSKEVSHLHVELG